MAPKDSNEEWLEEKKTVWTCEEVKCAQGKSNVKAKQKLQKDRKFQARVGEVGLLENYTYRYARRIVRKKPMGAIFTIEVFFSTQRMRK